MASPRPAKDSPINSCAPGELSFATFARSAGVNPLLGSNGGLAPGSGRAAEGVALAAGGAIGGGGGVDAPPGAAGGVAGKFAGAAGGAGGTGITGSPLGDELSGTPKASGGVVSGKPW